MAENDDIAKRPPDPFVAARISDPKAGPQPALTLVGLLGDSDRPGRRRLYLTTRLDYWVEIRTEDVLTVEDVGPDQPPFQGLDATRITVVRDARLDYVRTASAGGDPFAVQPLAAQAQLRMAPAETWEAECPGPSWGGCPTDIGCPTANDCPSGWTVCKPATCRVTERTCDTCANGATCGTTCDGTCRTCATCANTCAATCANTCAATCANTCANTCAATCRTCAATCRGTCDPDLCETFQRCPTFAQTHCNTCRCR